MVGAGGEVFGEISTRGGSVVLLETQDVTAKSELVYGFSRGN